MLVKIKEVYLPDDYEVQIHRKRQNLRQKELDVSGYMEEFHKLSLRYHAVEEESLKVARYLNGLRWNIQEELGLMSPETVHQSYQLALKVKEKLKRKHDSSSNRGRGRGKENRGHRGDFGGRKLEQITQSESKLTEQQESGTGKGGFNRGRGSNNGFRGRSSGQGRGSSYFASMKCYHCNQLGHPAYRCPEKGSSSHNSERRVNYLQEETSRNKTSEVALESEVGDNLMIR